MESINKQKHFILDLKSTTLLDIKQNEHLSK
jgi:hypothetical protein